LTFYAPILENQRKERDIIAEQRGSDQEKFLQTFAKLKKDLEEVEVLMRREFAQDIAILERSEQE